MDGIEYVLTAHMMSLVLRLKSANVDVKAVLAEVGWAPPEAVDPAAPVPLVLFGEFCTRCEEIGGDPLFALKAL